MNGTFAMGVDQSKPLFAHIFTSSHGVVLKTAETSPSSGAAFTWIYK